MPGDDNSTFEKRRSLLKFSQLALQPSSNLCSCQYTESEAGTMFNGKKVCYNFRKGRCRHGHKCKFAHDNDVSKDVTDNLYSVKYDEASQISSDKADTDTRPPISMVMVTPDTVDTDQDNGAASISSGKKKRPALSDNLTPSKKAMKFHNKVYN